MYHPLSHRYFQQHQWPCLQARATPLAPHQWKQMLASAQRISPSHDKPADAASDPPGTPNKGPESSNARLDASDRRPDSDAQSSGELHEPQTSAASARPDVVVLDVRNDYEWDAGHFQGADRPQEVCNFSHAGHVQCVLLWTRLWCLFLQLLSCWPCTVCVLPWTRLWGLFLQLLSCWPCTVCVLPWTRLWCLFLQLLSCWPCTVCVLP